MGASAQDCQSAQDQLARSHAQGDMHSRGKLVLSKVVVEKIASQAAVEVATAGGWSGGFLGIGSQADLSSRPKVSADLSGHSTTIQVELTLAYPTPIASAAEQVRRHMMERVSNLAGIDVTRVDVTVTALARHPEQKIALR